MFDEAQARESAIRRFWKYVRRGEPGECWHWEGPTQKGYGILNTPRGFRRPLAHRLSFELHRGPIAEGLAVLHRCDNPPCVNPDHLFLGTQRDNIRDAVKKGRHGRLMSHYRMWLDLAKGTR